LLGVVALRWDGPCRDLEFRAHAYGTDGRNRMLRPARQSVRYTTPYPRDAAIAACGRGRENHIKQMYALVKDAGGIVWDCEPQYGELHLGVELPGGEEHPAWEQLRSLWTLAETSCEICGGAGVLRDEREYWRVLCDLHARRMGP
jgi:hypothetical protein